MVDGGAGGIGSALTGRLSRVEALIVFLTIGSMTLMNLIAAGPIVTTQIAGKMQKTSGKTILTPVLAAASSARWRRLVRSVSE